MAMMMKDDLEEIKKLKKRPVIKETVYTEPPQPRFVFK
jgi:hypothetical protein